MKEIEKCSKCSRFMGSELFLIFLSFKLKKKMKLTFREDSHFWRRHNKIFRNYRICFVISEKDTFGGDTLEISEMIKL